ncbi:hypothetical protein RB601_001264 [Gaeumannomyces tritici]
MPNAAKRMAILSPYKANVKVIEKQTKNMEGSGLDNMPPPSTIDSIHGQKAEFVTIVFGTSRWFDPGFTTDPNRFNVALTR